MNVLHERFLFVAKYELLDLLLGFAHASAVILKIRVVRSDIYRIRVRPVRKNLSWIRSSKKQNRIRIEFLFTVTPFSSFLYINYFIFEDWILQIVPKFANIDTIKSLTPSQFIHFFFISKTYLKKYTMENLILIVGNVNVHIKNINLNFLTLSFVVRSDSLHLLSQKDLSPIENLLLNLLFQF